MIQWISENWPALFSMISMLLGVAVVLANMLHKKDVAAQIADIQSVIDKMTPSSPPVKQP